MLGLEFSRFFEEVHQLIEVENGLVHHLRNVVFVAAEPVNGVEHLLRDDVFFFLLPVFAPEVEVALPRIAQNI